MGTKYTRELLQPIVVSSCSVAQVIRKLGLRQSGGNHYYLSRKIAALGIDVSHFTGKASNRGPGHVGGNAKLLPSEILIYDRLGGKRERTPQLRRALIESGVLERCRVCDVGVTWQDRKLVLHVDHIDGDCLNNRSGNLRFLCPNCHSQTDTYCSKNRKA